MLSFFIWLILTVTQIVQLAGEHICPVTFFLSGDLWKPTDCFLPWFYQMLWRTETGSSCAALQLSTEYNVVKYIVIIFFTVLNISSQSLCVLHGRELSTTVWYSLAARSHILSIFVLVWLELGTLCTAGLCECDGLAWYSPPKSIQKFKFQIGLSSPSVCRMSTEDCSEWMEFTGRIFKANNNYYSLS